MVLELTGKQEAILDATLELIGERGFHGTPMSAIAEKAAVGAGTIYRYYESKEELINALYIREKQAINAQVLEGYSEDLPVRDAVGLMFRNAISARACQSARFRFLDQYYNSPFIGDDSRRIREQLISEYVEIIERGIRDLPRPVVMAMIFGPMAQLVNASQLKDVTLDDELIEQALEAIWRSIGCE